MGPFGFFTACFLITFTVAATEGTKLQKLTGEQIFHRCYSQMTRLYLPPGDARLKSIAEKNSTATEQCLKLIENASLNEKLLLKKDEIYSGENAAVLRTFNTLHTSWFQAYSFMITANELLTSLIYDSTEMAIPFTLALLKPGTPVNSILISDRPYSAVREKTKTTYTFDHYEKGEHLRYEDKEPWRTGGDRGVEWSPSFVEFGTLKGFQENQRNLTLEETLKGHKMKVVPGQAMDTGGVLGSAAYLILNSGLDRGKIVDGDLYAHRSWSKAVFKDLLCRDLPVLNEEDVIRDIRADWKVEFQKNPKCLTCHSTMDPMADVIRDRILLDIFDNKGQKPPNRSVLVGRLENGPHSGNLKYRTFDGRLVDKPIADLPDLAKALSESDDFFVCTAKKYFYFFTGIDLPLVTEKSFDERLKDPAYKFIVSEGLKLKQHQNVRLLFQNIFNSDFYTSKNSGGAVE